MHDREGAGREACPTAAVVDNQSLKTTESGGRRGSDAGEQINGRNRRLAQHFETSIASAEAFLYAASAMLLLRASARCE